MDDGNVKKLGSGVVSLPLILYPVRGKVLESRKAQSSTSVDLGTQKDLRGICPQPFAPARVCLIGAGLNRTSVNIDRRPVNIGTILLLGRMQVESRYRRLGTDRRSRG